jgi:hypothetical protein
MKRQKAPNYLKKKKPLKQTTKQRKRSRRKRHSIKLLQVNLQNLKKSKEI